MYPTPAKKTLKTNIARAFSTTPVCYSILNISNDDEFFKSKGKGSHRPVNDRDEQMIIARRINSEDMKVSGVTSIPSQMENSSRHLNVQS